MANKYETLRQRITWEGYKTPLNDANLNNIEIRIQEISDYLLRIQESGMLIGKGVIIGEDSQSVSPDTYLSVLEGDIAIAKFDSSDIKLFNNTTSETSQGYKPLLHIHFDDSDTNNDFISFKGTKITAKNIELPKDWVNINKAYEAVEENKDHKLLGGLLYKDFDGNITVFPLAPPYGIRADEVGEEYAQSSVAMYNSAQQLLVKPATDDRHAVPLSQLNEKLGKYLYKTGGTITGNLELKTTSNPSIKFSDSSDGNSASYVQAYKGKTYMGYSAAKSISVDKSGNVGVQGSLTVIGSVSCGEAKKDTDAVNVDYLNRRLETFGKPEVSNTSDASGVLKYLEEASNMKLASKGLSYDDTGELGYSVIGKGTCTDSDIVIPTNIIEGIYTGNRIEVIDYNAFSETGIKSVVIPYGIRYIGSRAFYDDNLSRVHIPNSVISIGEFAFAYNALKTITLPNSIKTIGNNAFAGSPTTINVPWAEGEIPGAPWGATSSTINYNYKGD